MDIKTFKYVAENVNRKKVRGYLEAPSLSAARKRLRVKGLTALSIDESNNILNRLAQVQIGKAVKLPDLVFFLKQLSVLVKSGIRLSEAIGIVAEQTENLVLQKILYKVFYEVQAGLSLSEGLQEHSEFPEMLVKMVSIGEATGDIVEALVATSEYYEIENKRRKALIKAFTGPLIYVIIGITVTISMLLLIFPLYTDMLGDSIDDLPWISAFFMDISNFLREDFFAIYTIVDGQEVKNCIGIRNFFVYYYDEPRFEINYFRFITILGSIGTLIYLRFKYRKTEGYRRAKSKIFLKLPLAANIIKLSNISTIATSLSNLIASKVDIIESLKITRDIIPNYVYKDILTDAIKNVEAGIPLSEAFENHWAVEDVVPSFISIGEQSNDIESMLVGLGNYYNECVEDRFEALKNKIQPLIMVSVYLLIGVLMIAMMLPTITAIGA